MGSKWDIAQKEIEDSFSSRRFLLLLLLFLAFSVGSVYMGIGEYQDRMDRFRSGSVYGNVPEKPSLVEVFEPMLGFKLPLAAALLALILSYNTIAGERESGTIELLLSYPVYRDEVINGKFIAGLFTVAIALLLAFVTSAGLAITLTGAIPSLTQAVRIWAIWIGSIVYMGFFLGLGTLVSTLFRSSWRALIVAVVLLVTFMATPMIARTAANHLYTYDEHAEPHGGPALASSGEAAERRAVVTEDGEKHTVVRERERQEQEQRYRVRQQREKFIDTVSKLSPTTSYERFISAMLGTNYRSSTNRLPTLAESLATSYGYLLFLISQTIAVFTLSYALFMRQDL